MKYNPKVNEDMARMPGFARLHPLHARGRRAGRAPAAWASCSEMLAEIIGMDARRCSRRPARRASWRAS